MADKFFVTAILVTHDGAKWLPEVIAAIGSQSRPVDRLVAVDTGSLDSTVKLLKSAGITTIPEEREMGYGDAIEHALALTPTADENEWIWLIHDDCAPDREALRLMLEALEERPQVAIVGPKILNWFDRDRIIEVGISIAGNGSRWTGLEENEQDQGQYDQITEVMAVSTAAMLVRRRVFEELGGLDINLALFRDDVDLGWRARVAGHSIICVPQASTFHIEASASERRAVDVSEAFLHRPLLLDRRNAAYVLLVNSSWWLLPWIALQLFATSVARAIINLLAKLPGYAGDEIAAVALLLANPAELYRARRDRKRKRLLAPRVVSHFIPSTWSQLQIALEGVRSSLVDAIIPDQASSDLPQSTFADIGTLDESFDDAEYIPPPKRSFWPSLLKKPQFGIAFLIAVISIFASRNRFGSLAGGALALSPSSGLDLLHRYAESWHLVSLGSAAPMPPWVALLGISSILTLGNLPLLLTLIFLFAPAITYLTIYRVLLRFEVQRGYALVGAGIYSASPLLWGAINQGRVGTLLVLQLFPTLLSLQPFSRDRERSTWRRTFSITLLTGVIAAFSPLLLITWLLVQLVLLVRALFEERHRFRDLGWATFIFSEHLDGAKRRFTLLITPWLLTFPWSASMLIHPTQIFLEPGISVTAGSRLDIALFNPGGAASVPTWILSPFIFLLVVSLIVPRLRSVAIAASALLGSALLISQLVVPGHGSTSQVWSGPLIAAAMGILLAPTIKFAQENIPTLVSRRLGFRHIGWSGLAAIIAFNLLAMPVWAVTGGANSLVKAEQISHVPAFVTALEQTPARPKTLVISSNGLQTRYFVTRGKDIQLGDADVVISIPDQIGQAMDELIAGSGLTSARTLGAFGIQYLYLQNPAPANIIRSVDGSGGFSRMSSTTAGIVWRIVGSNPRVLFVDKAGVRTTLDSNEVSAISRVNGPGVIQLAEKYDRGWRLLLDGRNIALEQSSNGLPFFTIPQAGEISLSHDGTLRRALLSVELITLTLAVVMALPAGRRRRELAEMQESVQ